MAHVFISYAREDQAFVRRLSDLLAQSNREVWVDWERIPPSTQWMEEIRSAINEALAFIFVVTAHSVASTVCAQEFEYALRENKRIVPLWLDAPEQMPAALAAIHGIQVQGADDVPALTALIGALDSDPAWVREHTRLAVKAHEWEHQGDDVVLRGADLAAADRWLADAANHPDPRPTDLQTRFVLASRAAQVKRQTTLLLAAGTAVAVALALAAWALKEKRDADIAAAASRAGELAALSQTATALGNPERALLFARHALAADEASIPARAAAAAVIDGLHERLVLQRGQGFGVRQAVFSGDDRRVLAAGASVRMWDVETRTVVFERQNATEGFVGAAFSPDGQLIVATAADHTPRILNAATGALVWEMPRHQRALRTAVFSPDSQRVLITSDDGTARISVVQSRSSIELRHADAEVLSARFSPDGRWVVTVGRDGKAYVWDSSQGTRTATLAHPSHVSSATFSPGGRRIVTTTGDGTPYLWNAEDGQLLKSLDRHAGDVELAVFSADGRRVATAGQDGLIRVSDTESGTLLLTLRGHQGMVSSVAFSPDSQRILTAGADGTARLWDANGTQAAELRGHRGIVRAAAFDHKGLRIVTAGDDDTVRVWDADGVMAIAMLDNGRTVAASVAFSPDGQRVATAGDIARVWDGRRGTLLRELRGHGAFVRTVAFSPDGRRLVTASPDRTARIWDAVSSTPLAKLDHQESVAMALFSRDGTRVLTTSWDRTAKVWDAGSGTLLNELGGHAGPVTAAAISPDGRRVVTGGQSDDVPRLWRLDLGEPPLLLDKQHGYVVVAAFDGTGSRLLTGSNQVRVWDVEQGSLLSTPAGPHAGPSAAVFSPDGQRILSGSSSDWVAYVSEASSGRLLRELRGHTSNIAAVAFSPDGLRAATASADGTARIWDASAASSWPRCAGTAVA